VFFSREIASNISTDYDEKFKGDGFDELETLENLEFGDLVSYGIPIGILSDCFVLFCFPVFSVVSACGCAPPVILSIACVGYCRAIMDWHKKLNTNGEWSSVGLSQQGTTVTSSSDEVMSEQKLITPFSSLNFHQCFSPNKGPHPCISCRQKLSV
jgi:hypothetical protein